MRWKMNSKMDPMGRAIADYHKSKKASKLRVFSTMFEEDEIPLTTLFRSYESMPKIERKALDLGGLENILATCPFPVNTVVGGFHLLDNHESGDKLSELAYRLTDSYPQTQFYTSHCTGDAVFATLHQVMGDKIYAFSCGTTNNN